MKWLLALIAFSAVAWLIYYNYHETPPPPPVVEATPTPVPTPVKHLAPPGVYYLLRHVSVTTDTGVTGIDEGTKVTLVKNTGNGMLVTDGQTQFEVTNDQVTNDIDIVDAVLWRDHAAKPAP